MNSVLNDTINSIRKDLAQQEARYNQSVTMPVIIDDDEEEYYASSKQTRTSMKRKKVQANESNESNESSNISSKKGRFNPSQLLAAFDKDINREFNLQQREIHKTEQIGLIERE